MTTHVNSSQWIHTLFSNILTSILSILTLISTRSVHCSTRLQIPWENSFLYRFITQFCLLRRISNAGARLMSVWFVISLLWYSESGHELLYVVIRSGCGWMSFFFVFHACLAAFLALKVFYGFQLIVLLRTTENGLRNVVHQWNRADWT